MAVNDNTASLLYINLGSLVVLTIFSKNTLKKDVTTNFPAAIQQEISFW